MITTYKHPQTFNNYSPSSSSQKGDLLNQQTGMNVSVLLIGSKHFTTIFLERYETPIAKVVETTSKAKIVACVSQQQPDIVLLEADLLDIEGLCYEMKQANTSSWVYCLAIEFCASPNTVIRESSQHLLDTAEAIENHADAYLKLGKIEVSAQSCLAAEQRLLLAYLQVAYRQVQQYQQLLKTNDFLSSIALADALTDLSNRRALEWDLPRKIQKAKKYNNSLSLAILDVDYFKSVNDNYGHLVGDRVLQLLAIRLRNGIRMQDSIFRYGGEEFVILFPQTSMEVAVAIAQKLCETISQTPFQLECGLTLSITLSLGLSFLQDKDGDRGIDLLRRADCNLFKAKSAGRNQIIY